MTTPAAGHPGSDKGHEGTVFDIGYRNYTGPREGRNRSQRAVIKDGIRSALGLGRPAQELRHRQPTRRDLIGSSVAPPSIQGR